MALAGGTVGLLSVPLVGWVGGVSLLVLFLVPGLLWRRHEPPAFSFAFTYQWLFIGPSYIIFVLLGFYPSPPVVGDLPLATALSLLGLLTLTAGVRWTTDLMHPAVERRFGARRRGTDGRERKGRASDVEEEVEVETGRYDIRRLFWLVVVIHAVDWVVQILPAHLWFEGAQLIDKILMFRDVLLFLLLYTGFRRRKGYLYLTIAVVMVFLPHFASARSEFLQVLMLAGVAWVATLRPGRLAHEIRRHNRTVVAGVMTLTLLIGSLVLLWVGGVKTEWRAELERGAVPADPVGRITAWTNLAWEVSEDFDVGRALTSLAGRTSSSLGYFSLTLDRVPGVAPHEDGAMSLAAARHLVTPRAFFPDKENLGGDSWLVRKYAGVDVAGEESGTSVGLTYMAQLYIDFGRVWMFPAVLLLGCYIGLLFRCLALVAPSRAMYHSAATVVVLSHVTNYGTELTKLVGGYTMSVAVFAAVLLVFGSWLERMVTDTPDEGLASERAPAMSV